MSNLIRCICHRLEKHIDQVNDLNVFPIPDKDTGTNILNTISSLSGGDLGDIAKGILFSARGSSGNILASFIIGAANSKSKDLHRICEDGYDNIVHSLSGIKDGTMASSLHHTPSEYIDVEDFLTKYQMVLVADLFDSTNRNETLKKYNTVDSGILALIYIVNGILGYLYNADEINIETPPLRLKGEIKTRYCNEYLINGKLNLFKKILLKLIGNELLVANYGSVTKIHIHSNHPKFIYRLFSEKMVSYKIEDMCDSNRRLMIKELT